MLSLMALMLAEGLNLSADSLATYIINWLMPFAVSKIRRHFTRAFDCLTCCLWNKNCLFKFEISIVSKSI